MYVLKSRLYHEIKGYQTPWKAPKKTSIRPSVTQPSLPKPDPEDLTPGKKSEDEGAEGIY